MGNAPSFPRPGTEFQVIGAGLSRTGTASFSEALRILLDGPVYHGGTQTTQGPEREIKSLIKILEHWPTRTADDKKVVLSTLKERLGGYAACTDAPFLSLVPELLEVYPNAIVICTTRDKSAWAKSIAQIAGAATMAFLKFMLLPVASMRYFPRFVDHLQRQWGILYGAWDNPPPLETYDNHIEYLKRSVPQEKLFFFDVREGWEPLCKMLGKPVPKDVPFPRINDGEAIDRIAKEMVTKGLIRWAFIGMAMGMSAYVLRKYI